LTLPFCIVFLLSHSRCQRRRGNTIGTFGANVVARATNQILEGVRSGEVQGDCVGKAAPADGQNPFCLSSKPEKYGASMAVAYHLGACKPSCAQRYDSV
jgi:hypothetical protein